MSITRQLKKYKPNLGRKLTDKWRENISNALRKRVVSDETRKKLSLINKGRKFSEEVRKNMSLSQKGKISPMKGKKFSEKAKENMRLGQKNRKRFQCSNCLKEIDSSNFNKHYNYCIKNKGD